jgi:hypothetical protein
LRKSSGHLRLVIRKQPKKKRQTKPPKSSIAEPNYPAEPFLKFLPKKFNQYF